MCYSNSSLIPKEPDVKTTAIVPSHTESSTAAASTKPEISEIDEILEFFDLAYSNDTDEYVEAGADEDEEFLFWTIIAISVFFSFFAIMAGYESVVLMLKRTAPPRPAQPRPLSKSK
ncbi:hypothetical protein OESDEN_24365 [Oesophagostomum dentatum]|uniref:Uncharacterized protein n=1 Tax=Oesophagostomum dentatum TaxID=61180 RepID=A0A0B1RWK5_OESDE|nr:hypothetical protein OESDEN_24365 [Oesophagostomum dentatum]